MLGKLFSANNRLFCNTGHLDLRPLRGTQARSKKDLLISFTKEKLEVDTWVGSKVDFTRAIRITAESNVEIVCEEKEDVQRRWR